MALGCCNFNKANRHLDPARGPRHQRSFKATFALTLHLYPMLRNKVTKNQALSSINCLYRDPAASIKKIGISLSATTALLALISELSPLGTCYAEESSRVMPKALLLCAVIHELFHCFVVIFVFWPVLK